MQRLGYAFDKLVADEIDIGNALSNACNAAHGIAEVANGGAAAFLVVLLCKPCRTNDVIDVINAGYGVCRIRFRIPLLNREIAGKEFVGILRKCSTNINDPRSDIGRMLSCVAGFPAAVVRRGVLIRALRPRVDEVPAYAERFSDRTFGFFFLKNRSLTSVRRTSSDALLIDVCDEGLDPLIVPHLQTKQSGMVHRSIYQVNR